MPDLLFAQLLLLLRQQVPGLLADAEAERSRVDIRASLARALGIDATDLSAPPRPDHWSVSISHTQGWGGWMAAPRPIQIGWDVERRTRLTSKIITRVSTELERAEAPYEDFLWPAKEAFFKALEDEQPAVFAPLSIDQWSAVAPDAWAWQGVGPRNARGLLVASTEWLMAAAIVSV